MKNLIGRILGYGSCPTCGNTWWRRQISTRTRLESEALEAHPDGRWRHRLRAVCVPCQYRWVGFKGAVYLDDDPGVRYQVR